MGIVVLLPAPSVIGAEQPEKPTFVEYLRASSVSLSSEVFDHRQEVIEPRIAAHRGRNRACGAGGLA